MPRGIPKSGTRIRNRHFQEAICRICKSKIQLLQVQKNRNICDDCRQQRQVEVSMSHRKDEIDMGGY